MYPQPSTEVSTPTSLQPDYQVLPPLRAEEYLALKEGIRVSGKVRDPIIVNRDGTILDGHHRAQIHGELVAEGVELAPLPKLIRQDLADDDQVACRLAARQFNMQRRHLGQAAKRALIADQLRETPERSSAWIAFDLGVDSHTVQAVREKMEASLEIPKRESFEGRDGRQIQRTHTKHPRLIEPPPPPIAAQETGDLRREHARLRTRARAIDAELRTRPRDTKRRPRTGWMAPQWSDAGIVLEVADASDLRAHVPDESVDLIVTSPPWNLAVGYDQAADDHHYDSLFAPGGRISRYASELHRIAGPQGRLCLNVPLQSWIDGAPRSVAADWLVALRQAGWHYRSTILWLKSGAGVKTSGVPVVGDGTPQQPIVGTPATDVVLVVHKDAWKLRHTGSHNLGTDDWPAITNGIWTFPAAHRERDEDGIALHPAPFPEELVRRCVVLFSYQHAVIADPFVGSGTTVIVAARLGRRCLGFDISETYIAQARARLETSLKRET